LTSASIFNLLNYLKITLVSIGFGVAISTMTAGGAEVEEGSILDDWDYGFWVDWSSRHTSRGRDYLDGDGALSQGVYFGWGDFGLELSRSGAMENGTEEFSLDLSYYREFDRYSFYGAYEYSDWTTNDFQVDGHGLEFGVAYFDFPGGFWIAGDVEYSIDRDGFFCELSAGTDLEVFDWLTLTPAVSVGINSGYVEDGHDGLNHVVASLSADILVTDGLKVSASAAYNRAINREPEVYADDAILRDFFWTGLTVSVGKEDGEGIFSLSEDWEVIFATSAWATEFGGAIAVDGSGNIRGLDGGDDEIHTGLSVEARRGRWRVLFDGSYVSFRAEVPPPLPIFAATPIEVRMAGVRLGMGYGVYKSYGVEVSLLAGLQYQHVEAEYRFTDAESRELNWLDPTMGIRGRVEIWEGWYFSGRAEVGGFGVGSDEFWRVEGGFGYELWDGLSVELRYQHLKVDYSGKDSAVDFELKGPKLGVSYRF